MPRYFFDTANGEQDNDRDGVILPDDQAALGTGVRYLAALLADKPDYLLETDSFQVRVRTETDAVISVLKADNIRPR